MTAKWKEVSAYTGQPMEEDAPTNFAGKVVELQCHQMQ